MGHGVWQPHLGLELEVPEGGIVIRCVRGHAGDHARALEHGDGEERKGVHHGVDGVGRAQGQPQQLLARVRCQLRVLAPLVREELRQEWGTGERCNTCMSQPLPMVFLSAHKRTLCKQAANRLQTSSGSQHTHHTTPHASIVVHSHASTR